MKVFSVICGVILMAMLAMNTPAFAKDVRGTIEILQSAKLGGMSLQRGEYQFTIDESNKVTLRQGRRLTGEAKGRWEERGSKTDATSLVMDDKGQIRELRPAGQKRVFILTE